jgi:hypothetical protein
VFPTRHGIKGLRQILTGFFDFRLPAQTMRNICLKTLENFELGTLENLLFNGQMHDADEIKPSW